jgi:cell division protein FtsW
MTEKLHARHHTSKPPLLFDPWLLMSTFILIGVGILMVASSSSVISDRNFGSPFYFVSRQGFFLLAGLAITLFALRIEVKTWQKLGPSLLIMSLMLLVAVMIPGIGREVNGSMRWINLGPIGVQVSEIAKLSMVVYTAGYLVRHYETVCYSFIGFLKPMLVLVVVASLLLLEPDFGATVVIFCTILAMLFLAGVRLWAFFVLILLGGGAMAMLAITSPYRMQRLTTFLNPWANQFDSGYQLTQSLIAFGRGGLLGVGLGDSVQKLFYLPEAHTDFLFAVIAEESGLIGGILIIILFAVLVYRGLSIGRRAQKQEKYFSAYTAYGLSIWIGLQVMINLGVNMGVLPTKGLTLPFMSYGGSSMIINFLLIALLFRIDFETRCQALGIREFNDD